MIQRYGAGQVPYGRALAEQLFNTFPTFSVTLKVSYRALLPVTVLS
jgi:hypothetical protein